jgi:hypothetical protein
MCCADRKQATNRLFIKAFDDAVSATHACLGVTIERLAILGKGGGNVQLLAQWAFCCAGMRASVAGSIDCIGTVAGSIVVRINPFHASASRACSLELVAVAQQA